MQEHIPRMLKQHPGHQLSLQHHRRIPRFLKVCWFWRTVNITSFWLLPPKRGTPHSPWCPNVQDIKEPFRPMQLAIPPMAHLPKVVRQSLPNASVASHWHFVSVLTSEKSMGFMDGSWKWAGEVLPAWNYHEIPWVFFGKKPSLEVLTGSLTLKITPGIPIRKGSSSCPIIFQGRAVELRGCNLRVELRFHSWGLHCIDNLPKLWHEL